MAEDVNVPDGIAKQGKQTIIVLAPLFYFFGLASIMTVRHRPVQASIRKCDGKHETSYLERLRILIIPCGGHTSSYSATTRRAGRRVPGCLVGRATDPCIPTTRHFRLSCPAQGAV